MAGKEFEKIEVKTNVEYINEKSLDLINELINENDELKKKLGQEPNSNIKKRLELFKEEVQKLNKSIVDLSSKYFEIQKEIETISSIVEKVYLKEFESVEIDEEIDEILNKIYDLNEKIKWF